MTAAPPIDETCTSDAAAWTLLLFIGAALAAIQLSSPLVVEASGLLNLLLASAALGGAAWFYRQVRPQENFAAMCIGLLQVLLFSAGGAILSYALARNGGALWDERLASWDRALGFDWLGYVRWVDGHASLAFIYKL